MSLMQLGELTGRTRHRQTWYGKYVPQCEFWGMSSSFEFEPERMWRDAKKDDLAKLEFQKPEPTGLMGKLWFWLRSSSDRDFAEQLIKDARDAEIEYIYPQAEKVIRANLFDESYKTSKIFDKSIHNLAALYSRLKSRGQ